MWVRNVKIWDGVSDQLIDADAIEIKGGKVLSLDSSDAVDVTSSQDMNGLVNSSPNVVPLLCLKKSFRIVPT